MYSPRIAEALEIEACQNSLTEEAPPVEEASSTCNGDDSNVFPDWLAQLGSVVGGFDDLKTCKETGELGQTMQLPANSIVSCKLTPTGETILSFQWKQENKGNSKNCSG